MGQLTITLRTSPELSPSRRRPRRVSGEGILLSENTQRRRKAVGEPRLDAAAWDSADLVLNRRRPAPGTARDGPLSRRFRPRDPGTPNAAGGQLSQC